jgi:hypothetical protein
MAAGNQATEASINNNLTQYAVQLRELAQNIADFEMFIITTGTAGLVAMGFTAADANTVEQMASYMNTIAGVYFGTATQASAFNFHNALSGLWAGD